MRHHRLSLWLARFGLATLLGLLLSGCAGKGEFGHKERPPTARTMLGLAHIMRDQGQTDQCAQVLMRITQQEPKFVPAYNELAELMVQERRFEAAVELLRAGLERVPGDAVLLNNTGMCYLLMQQYDQAVAYYTQACAARPQDARYRANLAMALGLQGHYEEAAALYAQVVPAGEVRRNLEIIFQARGDRAALSQLQGQAKAGG